MTIYIADKKILFVSAPKVACTSIKEAFFEVENGFGFRNCYANGNLVHIHNPSIYPALPFRSIPQEKVSSFLKLTMVRDPVKRFLSAYSNRVVHYKELSENYILEDSRRLGIPVNPSLSDFIKHLEEYRRISKSIRLHTEELCHFLGNDPNYYDGIYDISEIESFSHRVSEQISGKFTIPHLQTGGPKISVSELTKNQIDKITYFYRNDYMSYGDFFK